MTYLMRNLGSCRRFAICGILVLFSSASLIGSVSSQENIQTFAEGDVLKIMAFDRDDLTGQYTVQAGLILSLPLIGSVPLTNRTPRELEEILAKDWENRLGTPMSVTIEFAERAPFFVLGGVQSPGMYPYRSGLTVIQALAVSGGIEKLGAADARTRMDVLRERERRAQAIDRMAHATAARARLLAERQGQKEIEFPQSFTLVGKERMEELVAEQQKLLNARIEQDTLKEALFNEQISLGEAEIATYYQQYDALKEQGKLVANKSKRARRLPGQQIRSFELQQRSSTMETSAIAAQTNIAQVKGNVAAARNGIAAIRQARLQDISEGLVKADETFSEAQATELAAAQIMEDLGVNEQEVHPQFRLSRRGSTEYEVAGPSTLIRPGDVLDVFMPARKLEATTGSMATSAAVAE